MNDKRIIEEAVAILRAGGLVSFPTETVYGLGADARNAQALSKIFAAKDRPQDHPLIVHIADVAKVDDWAVNVSASARALAEAFWPGPLTLILQKKPDVLDLITGGQVTVGLRVPKHDVALALLHEFGGGLAAPSANKFGRISPTTAAAVKEELGDAVQLVLDGGACEVGVESTIVDVSSDEVVILRPGMISRDQIESVLKKSVSEKKKDAPRVSGSHESHYAPRTPTWLITQEDVSLFLQKNTRKSALLSRHLSSIQNEHVLCVSMPGFSAQYAHELYQVLRELDKKQLEQIVIEAVPDTKEWDAIRDRLMRAASGFLGQR